MVVTSLCLGLSLGLGLRLSLGLRLCLGLGLSLCLGLSLSLGLRLGLSCLGLSLSLGLGLSLCVGLKFIDTTVPVRNLPRRGGTLRRRASGWRRSAPLRGGRCSNAWCLVGLRMDILRLRGRSSGLGRALQLALEKLQACFDVNIGRIEIRSTSVGVKSIGDLVVARLILK